MVHSKRIEAVKDALVEQEQEALVAVGATDSYYFSGYRTVSDGDYPVVVIPQEGDATLIVSPLDVDAAAYASTINIIEPEDKFIDAIRDQLPDDGDILVTDAMHVKLYNKLSESYTVEVDTDIVSNLQRVKDEQEVDNIRDAYQVAEQALDTALNKVQSTMTEMQVAAEIEYAMRNNGSQGVAFPTIVATGASTSLPHHSTSAASISPGPLLFDIGATVNGYCSDMSRTVHIGEPSEQFEQVYETVQKAQEAAAKTLQSGVTAKTVDTAARDVISDAGYSDQFKHSTGHGVGIDVHESPNLSPKNDDTVLEDGMVITIEPGIYIKGEFGVRIEDAYHITENGAERLTDSSRDLTILDV